MDQVLPQEMTPERWKQIEQVFYRVVEVSPAERPALLSSSCGDDPALRREVQLLLDAEAESGSFFASGFLPRSAAAPVAEPAPSAEGRIIGHYQLLSAIGAGAMGEVYRARDTRLDRQVALKLLPARFATDSERVARFLLEAKASSALNHPNIVTVHDWGRDEDAWFIVTEFIDGVNLRKRMTGGRLELAEALDIAMQCAVALEAAHAAGISHRDIKPENIMLRPDGVVKIVDFGLARVLDSRQQPGATQTQIGALLGTPRYMSPEQARGERSDAATDVFSLGAVLYEMVTGSPAFPGEATADVLAALLTAEPKAPSALRRDLPRDLDRIVSKALAKQRVNRHQTMREFADDLAAIKQRLELGQLRPAPRPGAILRYAGLFAAAMAMVAAVAVAWNLRAPAHGPQPEGPPNLIPLTSFAGFKDYPALSPDGRRVAFSWNGGRGGLGGKLERNIYVKPVGTGDPVQLTDSPDDNLWPTWSPDGRQIAFGRTRRGIEQAFYVISAEGGKERKIAEGGVGVSWSPDGTMLALVRRHPTDTGGIFLVDARTGQQRDLTAPKPAYDILPVWSPDGRWIAFTRGVAEHRRDIWIVSSSGGDGKRVFSGERGINGLTWTADSRELVFSTQLEGVGEGLWRIAVQGGMLRRLEWALEGAFNPHIPAAGGRMAYTLSFIDTNVYRSRGPGFAGASEPRPFGREERAIVSSREDDSPSFSPDGQRVVFVSTRSGRPEIWTARRDGEQVSQLTFMKSQSVGSPRWSPDGRWIAFDCHDEGNTDVYVIGADGGSTYRLTNEGSGDYLPSWSADGQRVYFTSDRTGSPQLWRVPAAGGAATQITYGGARESWPAPDGKTVYFTRARPEAGIWLVPVEGGLERPVAELKAFDRVARSWGVIREGIYLVSRQDGPRQEIRFFNFATRRVTPLATLDREPTWNVPSVALSPDGRDLLTVHVDHEVNDLMLVENFR